MDNPEDAYYQTIESLLIIFTNQPIWYILSFYNLLVKVALQKSYQTEGSRRGRGTFRLGRTARHR